MSEKSDDRGFCCFPTVPDFSALWKHEIVGIPDHLEWSGTNRERFYFPDASQISAMIGDFPDISAKSGTVGHQKPRSSGIFPTYENQAFLSENINYKVKKFQNSLKCRLEAIKPPRTTDIHYLIRYGHFNGCLFRILIFLLLFIRARISPVLWTTVACGEQPSVIPKLVLANTLVFSSSSSWYFIQLTIKSHYTTVVENSCCEPGLPVIYFIVRMFLAISFIH